MANPWFRLYSEFATDPKVQMLSETDQRRYIMLLCMRCSNGDVTLQDEFVTFQLRINIEDWLITKAILINQNLITELNNPTAWDKRQFVSDTSAARVSKHRESKKQGCNVTETPPDTDTDTDTDIKNSCASQAKRESALAGFEKFWALYPKRKNRGDAEKAWKSSKLDGETIARILEAVEVAAASDDWRKDAGKWIPYPASWLRAKGWQDDAGVTFPKKKPGSQKARLNHLGVVEELQSFGGINSWSSTGYTSLDEYEAAQKEAA